MNKKGKSIIIRLIELAVVFGMSLSFFSCKNENNEQQYPETELDNSWNDSKYADPNYNYRDATGEIIHEEYVKWYNYQLTHPQPQILTSPIFDKYSDEIQSFKTNSVIGNIEVDNLVGEYLDKEDFINIFSEAADKLLSETGYVKRVYTLSEQLNIDNYEKINKLNSVDIRNSSGNKITLMEHKEDPEEKHTYKTYYVTRNNNPSGFCDFITENYLFGYKSEVSTGNNILNTLNVKQEFVRRYEKFITESDEVLKISENKYISILDNEEYSGYLFFEIDEKGRLSYTIDNIYYNTEMGGDYEPRYKWQCLENKCYVATEEEYKTLSNTILGKIDEYNK